MMGARERVLGLIDGAWTTQAIAAGCSLGLFDALAAGPNDAATIAARAGADADGVARLLKALATLGLCEARDGGNFALTPDGECLRADSPGSLQRWASLSGSRLWSNWASLPQCIRTGRSARELRGQADFRELDADQRAAAVFNAAMIDLTRPVADAAAANLDWAHARSIVDVGGGAGALALAILQRHPHLQATVCDLAHARAAAEALAGERGLAARCRFEQCDFFTAVPAAADAYLLKSVLHNWPDARALEILRVCARAAARGARVIVVERLEPATPGTGSAAREVARSDLNMLVGCGGRERSESEFRALFAACGLAVRSVVPLANGFHAIEAA